MTIYSHWINDTTVPNETYERKFFGRKGQQEAEAKAAVAAGKKVLNTHSAQVEPTAEAVAAYMNETCCVCPSDLVKEYVDTVILGAGE